MWRLALVLTFACEHRPAPKPQTDTLAAVVDAAPVPVGDDACLQIGAKITDIIISAATDATQKAAYEQERTKLVKRFSDNCTNEKWPDATRACFLGAKAPADVEACSRALAQAQPATPPPSAPPGTVN